MTRRRLKRTLALLGCTLLAGAAGYALLPWLLPRRVVQRIVVSRLELEFGREVRLGSVSLSWRGGVELHDLAIRRLPQFGPGELVRIGRVRTAFEPLSLLRNQLGQVVLEDVQLYAVATETDLNLRYLPPLNLAAMELQRLVVHWETHLAGETTDVVFEVPLARVEKDLERGGVRWTAAGTSGPADPGPAGSFETSGQWGLFFSSQPPQPLRLVVNDLNLAPLRLDRWLRLGRDRLGTARQAPPGLAGLPLPAGALTGRCSLKANVRVGADGKVAGEGRVQLAPLCWGEPGAATAGEAALNIPAAEAELAGQFDPATNLLVWERLAVHAPGLALKATGRVDPRPGAAEALVLKLTDGEADPAAWVEAVSLPQLTPWRDRLGAGPVRFAMELRGNDRRAKGRLEIDASDWAWRWAGREKPAGELLRLAAAGQLNRDDGRAEVQSLSLEAGPLRVAGALSVQNWYALSAGQAWRDIGRSPREFLQRVLGGTGGPQVQLDVEAEDLAPAAALAAEFWPATKQAAVSGPATLRLEAAGVAGGLDVKAQAELSETASCQWQTGGKTVFAKPAGQGLILHVSTRLREAGRVWEDLTAAASLGSAQARLSSGRVEWQADDGLPASRTAPAARRRAARPWRRLEASWQVAGLERWQEAFPALAGAPAGLRVELAGEVQGRLEYAGDPNGTETGRLATALEGANLLVSRRGMPGKPLFEKQRQTTCRLAVSGRQTSGGGISFSGDAELGSLRATFEGAADAAGMPAKGWEGLQLRRCQWQVAAGKLAEAASYFPALADDQGWIAGAALAVGRLRGAASLSGRLAPEEAGAAAEFVLEAAPAGFVLARRGREQTAAQESTSQESTVLWDKLPGSPCRLEGTLHVDWRNQILSSMLGLHKNPGPEVTVDLRQLSWATDGLSGRASGSLVTDLPAGGWAGIDALSLDQQVQLEAAGNVAFGGDLFDQVPALAACKKDYELSGKATWQMGLKWNGAGRRLALHGGVDLTEAALALPLGSAPAGGPAARVHKPAGAALALAAELVSDESNRQVELQDLHVGAAGNELVLSGRLEGADLAGFFARRRRWPGREAQLEVRFDANDLAAPAAWYEPCRQLALNGSLRGQATLMMQFEPALAAYLQPSSLDGQVNLTLGDRPVSVEFRQLGLSSPRVLAPGLTLRLGGSDVTFVADVREPLAPNDDALELHQPRGTVDVVAEQLDLVELSDWFARLLAQHGCGPGNRTASRLTATPGSPPLDFGPWVGLDRKLSDTALAWLRRWRLDGVCDLGHVRLRDAATGVLLDLQEVRGRYQLAEGILQAALTAGLGGGVVDVEVYGELGAPQPKLWYRQVAREMQAKEALRGLVESEFPGLQINGTISEKKEFQGDLWSLLEGKGLWRGQGVTHCRGGVLYGPGGAEWVLQLFPGLKLVEYPWREMINQFECLPDGSKRNEMRFVGDVYDIYIEGVSRPVQDPNHYAEVMRLLEQDVQAGGQRVAALAAGELNPSAEQARWLRRQADGLTELWRRHQAGERLRVAEADYLVGGLLSRPPKELFARPTALLRVPIFQTHSYIVEQQMVGIRTRSLNLQEVWR